MAKQYLIPSVGFINETGARLTHNPQSLALALGKLARGTM